MRPKRHNMALLMRCASLALVALVAARCDTPTPTPAPGPNGGSTVQTTPHAPNPPLSVNDVSWLFPAPNSTADMNGLIAIKDVKTPNGDPVWSPGAFAQFLSIANGPGGVVGGAGSRISLPQAVQSIDAWQIAGIRIDAGAPGLADAVRAQYGQSPQIRIILHPVLRNADGTPDVQDIAAHLIFSFTQPTSDAPLGAGCLPRPKPDLVAFREIVDELAAIRTKLANGDFGAPVSTAGAPLGVHPGLRNPATVAALRQEMKAFLERHVSAAKLTAMAVMGLPQNAPAPWIFVSMLEVAPGAYAGVPSAMLDGTQTAEALTPAGVDPRVTPAPQTNNLAPITCANAVGGPAALPVATRRGVATADIFASSSMPAAKMQSILARIDDPTTSHFFNTDCVSCHTETRLGMDRLGITRVAGIDTEALPNGPYNVRNFGWSPPIEGPPSRSTVTRRALAETEAVVNFINTQLAAE